MNLDPDEIAQLLEDLRAGVSDDPTMAQCRVASDAMKTAAELIGGNLCPVCHRAMVDGTWCENHGTPTNQASDTPRTDAAISDFSYRDECGQLIQQEAIHPYFARLLERELRKLAGQYADLKGYGRKMDFDEWIARELPRATGFEIDQARFVWDGARSQGTPPISIERPQAHIIAEAHALLDSMNNGAIFDDDTLEFARELLRIDAATKKLQV